MLLQGIQKINFSFRIYGSCRVGVGCTYYLRLLRIILIRSAVWFSSSSIATWRGWVWNISTGLLCCQRRLLSWSVTTWSGWFATLWKYSFNSFNRSCSVNSSGSTIWLIFILYFLILWADKSCSLCTPIWSSWRRYILFSFLSAHQRVIGMLWCSSWFRIIHNS